jgi:hypothetical protein
MEDLIYRIIGMLSYDNTHGIHEKLRADGHSEEDLFLTMKAALILYKDMTGEDVPLTQPPKTRKVTIKGHGDNINVVAKATLDLRYSDYRTQYELTVTQTWTWKGGDAIVLLVKNPYGNLPRPCTVIRVGKKVQVIEAPLATALPQVGIPNFKIA